MQISYSHGRAWYYDDDGYAVGLRVEDLEDIKEQINNAIKHINTYDPSNDVPEINYPGLPF
jgi:hypothetical protein